LVYPALYNGPINYFARLVMEEKIVLEQHEHYTKQTFRNRCVIVGPNGPLALSIPVKRRRGAKTLMKDIRPDEDTPWRKIHWRSLVAAYAASPFFQYFRDELAAFYEKRHGFLIDLNRELIILCLSVLGREIPVQFSGSFSPMVGQKDPRWLIHPKRDPGIHDPLFRAVPYHQVFSDRHGFIPNLSILDLLFNEGYNALPLLEKSLRT